MQYLIVTDVFGRTNALLDIASKLNGSVDILDLYDSKNMQFDNETEAYNYFMSHVGVKKYAKNLINAIQSYSAKIHLIGFSVGASTIWKISSQNDLEQIHSAVCFYGSQIRYFKEVEPNFSVKLIFPVNEKHFSVSKLISELSDRNNVEIVKTIYGHGFLNKHSENFNQMAYDKYTDLLCNY